MQEIQVALPGKATAAARALLYTHSYQYAVYSCVQTMGCLGLSEFSIFIVCTDGGASDCTLELCERRRNSKHIKGSKERHLIRHKRVCTESWHQEYNPLPHRGIEPVSVLLLAFQSDVLPTVLTVPAHSAKNHG